MNIKIGDWVSITSTASDAAMVVKITDQGQLEDIPGYITYTLLSDKLSTLLNEEIF